MRTDKYQTEMIQSLLRYKKSNSQFAMKKLIQKATEGKASTISEIPPELYRRVAVACKSAPLTLKDVERAIRGFIKRTDSMAKTIAMFRRAGFDLRITGQMIPEEHVSKIIDTMGGAYRGEFEKYSRDDARCAIEDYEMTHGCYKAMAMLEKMFPLVVQLDETTIPKSKYRAIINACRGVKPKPRR